MNKRLPRASVHSPGGSSPWLFALVVSALASLAILLPFFRLGSASGHDFEFHVASWLDVADQWRHGVLWPRWTAWTNYGYGEPRYLFYPPLSWLLGAALTFILPLAWVPAGFIFVCQTLAGLSAFSLLRRLAPTPAACLGAAFYAANPYALLVSYIRSDFAEQLACALFSLLLLAALRLAGLSDGEEPRRSRIPSFALLYAAVWLCNAPAGVIASYAMALLFAAAALWKRSWGVALRCAAGLALGLGLSAFYLLPAAYEQRWVNIAQALSSGLLPSQNFLFTAINDVEHTWFNWISSFCALLLILFAALTALASRKLARRAEPSPASPFLWRAMVLLAAAATLLMLRVSLPIWDLLPKLRYVQFPWRWMSVVAVIGSCFLAAAMERRRGWLWFALYALVAVPLGQFLVQNTWWDPDEMSTQQAAIASGTGYEGVDEYDPLGDDHLDLPKHAPLAAILPVSADEERAAPPPCKIRIEAWQPTSKRIAVECAAPARVALRLLNYPAWQVRVNDRGVTPERLDDINQMLVPVGAGPSEIQVRFARTPDRTLGYVLSAASLVMALLLFV